MGPGVGERLTPDHRLRTTREYDEVKRAGMVTRGRHCLLISLPKPGHPTRVGFLASKKGVGDAVHRNRARRRLREIVRRRWPRMPDQGFWLIFVAFRSTPKAPHQELATEVEHLLAGSGALLPIAPPR